MIDWSHVGLRNVPRRFKVTFHLGSSWDVIDYFSPAASLKIFRRSSWHCLDGFRNVSKRSQEGLFELFHLGSDPDTAWDAPGMHPCRNKSTHTVQSVIYWILCLGTVWRRSWVELVLLRGTSQLYQYLTKMDPGEMSPGNVLEHSWVPRVTSL